MGIAEGMKDIVENIVDSHHSRAKEINRVVMDTRRILKEARTILQGFSKERKVSSSEQAKKLAGFVTDLRKNVGNMLKEFREDHKEMSEKQAKNLGMFIGKLKNDSEKLKEDVCSMLEDFKSDRKEMAEELREKLAKEVQDIKAHVEGILAEANELISGYRSDMKGARAAWQGMPSILAKAKKGVVTPKVEENGKGELKGDSHVKKPFENRHFENKTEKKVTKKKKK
ncbi:MAG: hypothetical protein ABII25_02230 [bacterium]